MNNAQEAIGTTIHLEGSYDEAIEQVTEALKAAGFGVLTEIDVTATLKKKLDVDFPQYKILGACNPSLAHRALRAAPDVGLLLPCNVTVAQGDNGGVNVSIINPNQMMGFFDAPELQAVAQEASQLLQQVAEALVESQ